MMETWYWFKHKVFPSMLAYMIKAILHLLVKTCRFKISGLETFKETAAKEKCVLMFWHNRIAIIAEILTSFAPEHLYTALISQSRDGEIIATIVNSYPIGSTIRVAHNNRKTALDQTIRQLQKENKVLIITPDGPKGPLYRMKRGPVFIAKAAEATIVPLSWKADQTWHLNTWDKMMIPKPFSTIQVTFGSPLKLAHGNNLPSRDEIDALEQALLQP